MKLVTKNIDVTYLHSLKGLLEENGIPAYVSGENTARMITPYVMTEPCLWVCIDEQEDEARKLIDDPNYVVVNKVNVGEFYEQNEELIKNPKTLNGVLIGIIGWAILLVIGMFVGVILLILGAT